MLVLHGEAAPILELDRDEEPALRPLAALERELVAEALRASKIELHDPCTGTLKGCDAIVVNSTTLQEGELVPVGKVSAQWHLAPSPDGSVVLSSLDYFNHHAGANEQIDMTVPANLGPGVYVLDWPVGWLAEEGSVLLVRFEGAR